MTSSRSYKITSLAKATHLSLRWPKIVPKSNRNCNQCITWQTAYR